VVPTVLSGGTTSNTVPAQATVAVDVRAWEKAEQQRVDQAIRELRPILPGARVRVEGGINRPPLDPESSAGLFELAKSLDPDLTETAVGGASDGNFTAGLGIATLDGLGAVGDGAHADHEHVIVAEIPRRTELLTRLVRSVLTN
jgi:glutamate carboxypeptidase